MKKEKPMLKGTQKRILQIKSPNSALFEEAYFILKPTSDEARDDDMVTEAERLLASATLPKKKRRFSLSWEDVLVFLAGVALSFVIFGVIALFFA